MTSWARGHVFVADVTQPELDADDRHHLTRVLRLHAGDEITVADGAGQWRRCRFGKALEPVGEVVAEPRPDPEIGVAFAVTKGERPDWAVQKMTELGVDRIVPFVAARSVVRWEPDRAARQVARWRRIAREAAGQSRRAWLPRIDDVTTFAEAVALPGAALAEQGGLPPTLDRPLVLVGPEGGWAAEELSVAGELELPLAGLGPHVLRAETAAIAAVTLLSALRERLVR